MGLSLKSEHLKRYKDIARLLYKYGRTDWVKLAGLESELEGVEPMAGSDSEKIGRELAADLEQLGPTYIKLGQLLSTRSDLLPHPYLKALSRLQDKVSPFPYSKVEPIVFAELGVRISKAFSDFDESPLAAASLGQVHWARLRDGRPVAVKVQRPDIRQEIITDLEALEDIAVLLDKHSAAGEVYSFSGLLEEFRKSLIKELDYRVEAQNLRAIGRNLEEFERLIIPRPVEDYTSSRVLTMDFIPGTKITGVSPLARMEMDGRALAEQFFNAYLKQILIDGFFHADPHPGNVFLTRDGDLALLDLGMVGRIPPALQENLIRLLVAVSHGEGEEAARQAIRLGEATESFREKEFIRRTAGFLLEYHDRSIGDLQVGGMIQEISRIAGENGLRLPSELALLGRTLFAMDEVGRALEPNFEPSTAVRENTMKLMRQRAWKAASPSNVVSTFMELNEFTQKLPGRVNRILDALANNNLQVRVDAIDERRLIDGLQKIANRITLGLILAALIVGAAMLMRVETDFELWGYPGLAMLLFLAAAGGGFYLAFLILFRDEKPPANQRRFR